MILFLGLEIILL